MTDAAQIHRQSTVMDLHAHPSTKTYFGDATLTKRQSAKKGFNLTNLRTSHESLVEGGIDILCSAVYVPEQNLKRDCWVFDVGGVRYSLVRVYTIDLDSDNRVDDVGFRLKAPGKPDLAISYLGGDLPGATLPELQLSDEGVIERLCFESRSFEMLETS